MRDKQIVSDLKSLRSSIAFEMKSNHSWSFSDKELFRLVEAKPKSLEDLGKIKGFPREGKRVKSYGQNIIDIFNGKDIEKFNSTFDGTNLHVETVMKPLCNFKK